MAGRGHPAVPSVPMSDDSEMWGTLRGDNVTLLERWESAGNDLLERTWRYSHVVS